MPEPQFPTKMESGMLINVHNEHAKIWLEPRNARPQLAFGVESSMPVMSLLVRRKPVGTPYGLTRLDEP